MQVRLEEAQKQLSSKSKVLKRGKLKLTLKLELLSEAESFVYDNELNL